MTFDSRRSRRRSRSRSPARSRPSAYNRAGVVRSQPSKRARSSSVTDSLHKQKELDNEKRKKREQEEQKKKEEEEDKEYKKKVQAELLRLEQEEAEPKPDPEELRRLARERRRQIVNQTQHQQLQEQKRPEQQEQKQEQQEQKQEEQQQEQQQEKEEDGASSDREDEDDFDMFCESPVLNVKQRTVVRTAENMSMSDNWDDREGYYCFRLGDVLNDRYEVFANQGRGVFSTVLRVRDTKAGNRELVVKLIRRNPVMYKAGLKEVNLLKIVGANDPDNHRHCVRFYNCFEHRNHLCLVFEPMHMNLREVLKKFGGVGINIDGVRSYTKQLFVALRLLKRCKIVHGDIKPDNMLVNKTMNILKLSDFGSAGMVSDCEITPYLVSRFYRAPEISLGLPYDTAVDVWSVGCVLFELYTGDILFKGVDNNDMLRLIQETKGKFPARMLRKAAFASQHFDEDLSFEYRKIDTITNKELRVRMKIERPKRDILSMLRHSSGRLSEEASRRVAQLRDLIEKCIALDPSKRLTPEAAKQHPFLID